MQERTADEGNEASVSGDAQPQAQPTPSPLNPGSGEGAHSVLAKLRQLWDHHDKHRLKDDQAPH